MLKTPDIRTLSIALCAPVNGEAPAVTASLLSFFATTTPMPSTTSVSGVSASFATAAPSPSPNPANILSYPNCAVSSGNHLIGGLTTTVLIAWMCLASVQQRNYYM